MIAAAPRVAIAGIALESNAFAPAVTLADFEGFVLAEGDQIRRNPHTAHLVDPDAGPGFARGMSAHGPWEPVPVLVAMTESGGPLVHEDYTRLREAMERRLSAAGRIDAVYLHAHGAGTTTLLDDLDGDYFSAIRDIVGPGTPIVATLDLHANVSETMVRAADGLVAYRTNPHVDITDREEEAAGILCALLAGAPAYTAFLRLPLVTAQVTQLTAAGQPLGELVEEAERHAAATCGVLNASILPGFAFGDGPHNGLAVLVLATTAAAASRTCLELARRAWELRARFVPRLCAAGDALASARANVAGDRPILIADVADNPGGGGTGGTTALLRLFVESGLDGVQAGVHTDAAVVRAALTAGEGSQLLARFNSSPRDPQSEYFEHAAAVERITNGRFTGRFGMAAGLPVDLGPACLLRIAGVRVAVISRRQQILGACFLEHFGLRPVEARAILVKSRGHFRAGFAHVTDPGRILEVDGPGLTTPRLERVAWRGLARPCFPLDTATSWRAVQPALRASAWSPA